MGDASFYTVGARGITLRVRARPGAHRDAITGVRDGELVVEVRARPEKGKANGDLARLLARELGLTRDSVVLKLGGASRRKVFELPLASARALERWSKDLRPGGAP